jgi:hypothetical protein
MLPLSAFVSSDAGCIEEAAMPILCLSLSLSQNPSESLSLLSRDSVSIDISKPRLPNFTSKFKKKNVCQDMCLEKQTCMH